MKTAIAIGVGIIALILLAVILLPEKDPANDQFRPAQEQNETATTFESAGQSTADKSDNSQAPPDSLTAADSSTATAEPGTDDALERALASMRESLAQEDPRTPEMSTPYQRELPTAEELADPTLYEAYELRQTRKIAAIFAGVNKEIPAVRNKITAAKLSGSRTEEEIREAEEALANLESLSEMLRLAYPELESEADQQLEQLQQLNRPDQPAPPDSQP